MNGPVGTDTPPDCEPLQRTAAGSFHSSIYLSFHICRSVCMERNMCVCVWGGGGGSAIRRTERHPTVATACLLRSRFVHVGGGGEAYGLSSTERSLVRLRTRQPFFFAPSRTLRYYFGGFAPVAGLISSVVRFTAAAPGDAYNLVHVRYPACSPISWRGMPLVDMQASAHREAFVPPHCVGPRVCLLSPIGTAVQAVPMNSAILVPLSNSRTRTCKVNENNT
jgi:hypothetical protein